jgi:hypothetical protein
MPLPCPTCGSWEVDLGRARAGVPWLLQGALAALQGLYRRIREPQSLRPDRRPEDAANPLIRKAVYQEVVLPCVRAFRRTDCLTQVGLFDEGKPRR